MLVALCFALGLVGALVIPTLSEDSDWRHEAAVAGASSAKTQEESKEDEPQAAAAPEPIEEVIPYGDESLPRDESIRGKVMDTDLKPVPDVVVIAFHRDADVRPYQIVLDSKVRTREDGTFVLGPLQRKSHSVFAFHEKKGLALVLRQLPGSTVDMILTPGAAVEGKVADLATGKPVVGARVVVQKMLGLEAATDDEGRYRLPMVPPSSGWWGTAIMVLSDKYERQQRTNLVLRSGDSIKIDFALVAGGTLKGRVVDAQTLQPITDASVAEGWEPYHKTTRTGADGTFVLKHVDVSPNRSFGAQTEGYGAQLLQSDGTGRMEFSLVGGLVLSGQVKDPSAKPLAGARVRLMRIKFDDGLVGAQSRGRGNVIETGADGRFVIHGVLPGKVAVAAFHPDYAPGESEPLEIGADSAEIPPIEIMVKHGATLAGTVRGPGGDPIADLPVALTPNWKDLRKALPNSNRVAWSERPQTHTDAQGNFRLSGIIAGKAILQVGRWGVGMVSQQVPLAEGEEKVGLVIEFGGGKISGSVTTADGIAVPSVQVWASVMDSKAFRARGRPSSQRRSSAQTDTLGRFTLIGLADGVAYTLRARHSAAMTEPLKDILVGNESVQIKFKPSQVLRVRVRSAVTNGAVRRFNLSIQPKQVANSMSRRLSSRMSGSRWSGNVESPDGSFERRVQPGTYTLAIKADGHAPEIVEGVVVEEGIDPTPVRVTMDAGAHIRGVVLGLDGKPARKIWVQARVHLQPGEKQPEHAQLRYGGDQTDHEGRYFIQGVMPGRYVLEVNRNRKEYGNALVQVAGDAAVIQNITLMQTGKIVILVTDEDGKPVPQVWIQMQDPDTSRWLGWGRTNAQGIVPQKDLRQGAVKLTPTVWQKEMRDKYVIEPLTVRIEPGQTLNVTMVLKFKPKDPSAPATDPK